MTDLNEKLKLVAFYDGKSLHQKNDGKIFIHNELSFDLAIYHTSYDWQIPVWQKVCKEAQPKFSSFMNFDFIKIEQKYYRALKYNTPLESFEILVQAIQFINKMKK